MTLTDEVCNQYWCSVSTLKYRVRLRLTPEGCIPKTLRNVFLFLSWLIPRESNSVRARLWRPAAYLMLEPIISAGYASGLKWWHNSQSHLNAHHGLPLVPMVLDAVAGIEPDWKLMRLSCYLYTTPQLILPSYSHLDFTLSGLSALTRQCNGYMLHTRFGNLDSAIDCSGSILPANLCT